jgi:hypothetical protein
VDEVMPVEDVALGKLLVAHVTAVCFVTYVYNPVSGEMATL